MSRVVSKHYAALYQFNYFPRHFEKLNRNGFSSVQPTLVRYSTFLCQRWTKRLTDHQVLSKDFSNIYCKGSTQEKFIYLYPSLNFCHSFTGHSRKLLGCPGHSSLKHTTNSNKYSSEFSYLTKFYHSSQSSQERHTSPNVRLHDSSDITKNEDNPIASNNENLNGTRSSSSSSANKGENSNTDFGVQLTLAQKFVESCPSSVQPYLQLMRIDRPIGTWLLFWPCGWGLALAAGAGNLPDPWLLAMFGCGALVMRGAGCTINDLWDKDIDSKVIRTKDRPLASGAVQPLDAVVFLGAQLGTGLLVLLQLNWHSILLGAASLGLVCTYPLVKRVSYWPQLVLGLTFNWGVLLGWCAVHGSLPALPLLPLYAAGVFWTLIYDTIYAHQDKLDDLSIGIKSTALMFGDSTRAWLGVFGVGMVGSLLLAGHVSGLAWPHYVATAATAANIVYQLQHLDIHNRAQCGRQFRHNRHVGLLVFLGLVGGSLLAQTPEPSEPTLWVAPSPSGNQMLLQE